MQSSESVKMNTGRGFLNVFFGGQFSSTSRKTLMYETHTFRNDNLKGKQFMIDRDEL